ncbi:CynX/NimT family MFS transporter [Brevibacterium limosum]|uniref:CynX/NimT family MFS transporter n=1 Tax=Brevibacterium limosum TaxID=2697565 RepID=UPI001AA0F5F0|nr:MFS transporter [Brevibacterium limosum]
MKRLDQNFDQDLSSTDEVHTLGEPPNRVTVQENRSRMSLLVLGAGLILIGLNLRIGVASVGPVLGDILDDLRLSATEGSFLTTIPVFSFGAFAFLTPALTRRFGMHRVLGILMIVLAAGIALRLQPSLLALYGGTVLVGAAIAVGNVLLPAAIKSDFSHRAGLMMGLYSTSLFLGAALASGLTVPIMSGSDGSWRWALGIWAAPAVLAVLLWLPQLLRRPVNLPKPRRVTGTDDDAAAAAPSEIGEPPFRSILTDPIAWAVTGFMGLQSLSYYAALTWVPAILQDGGMAAGKAGWMMSYSALPAILTCLFTPSLAQRMRPRWIGAAAASVLTGSGIAGLLIAPVAGASVWMTLMGLGQGAAISLSLSYIVWRSPDAHHTGHVSTMAQGMGYLFAGLGPFGLGWLHTVTGSWTLPLVTLLVLLAAQLLIGGIAAQDKHVRTREADSREVLLHG